MSILTLFPVESYIKFINIQYKSWNRMKNLDDLSFELVNVVATGDLDMELDLDSLSEELGEQAEKNESSLDVRLTQHEDHQGKDEEEITLIKFFDSGSYILLGADNLTELKNEHERLIESLKELDEGDQLVDENTKETLEVHNVVGVAETNEKINLEALSVSLGLENVEYEPERFPAVFFRSPDYPCTFSVFAPGKIVISGGDNPKKMEKAFERFVEEELREIKEMENWMS